MAQGFYELLGVDEDASLDAVRAAYQRRLAQLVRRLRDSRRLGADVSILESQERDLRAAMDVLADPVRRRRYDAYCLASRDGMPSGAEELWERARASMIDPSSALALALVRQLTQLPVGDPLPLPPESRVQRVQDRPARGSSRPPGARGEPARSGAGRWDEDRPTVSESPRPTAVPSTDSGIPNVALPAVTLEPSWIEASAGSDPFPKGGPVGVPVAEVTDVVEDYDDDYDEYNDDFDDDFGDDAHREGGQDFMEPDLFAPDLFAAPEPPRVTPAPVFQMPVPSLPAVPADPVERLAQQHGATGAFLAGVRELRDMSVEELSRATRISTRYISAIEEDGYDRLPSATFVRGYIKQIQRVLEVDDDGLVDAFMEAYRANRE